MCDSSSRFLPPRPLSLPTMLSPTTMPAALLRVTVKPSAFELALELAAGRGDAVGVTGAGLDVDQPLQRLDDRGLLARGGSRTARCRASGPRRRRDEGGGAARGQRAAADKRDVALFELLNKAETPFHAGARSDAARCATAVPSPPPMHSVATPRFWPRAFSACISVTMMRAPLAPIGWPSAQAPPCTLTMSCDTPSSCISAIGTTAKASFTSHRSTSFTLQPVFWNSLATAPTGAVENHSGCCACVAWATMRAMRLGADLLRVRLGHHHQRRGAVVDRRARRGGDGAVFLLERGLQRGDLVELDLARAFVDRDHGVAAAALDGDRRDLGLEGAGARWRALARSTLAMANASCCSRVNLYLAAQSSPKVPIERPGW